MVATLGVHRATILLFADPLRNHLAESKLLSHFMQAVFLQAPPYIYKGLSPINHGI